MVHVKKNFFFNKRLAPHSPVPNEAVGHSELRSERAAPQEAASSLWLFLIM